MARRPATMRDVAARAGVSRSLVSTVFRDVPGASPQTRQRILDAAADLGYLPDDRARKLRSRESRLIGVTLTAVHPFHVAVVEALHDAAELHGFELAVSLNTASRPLHRAVDTLLAQRCAALILVGPTAPSAEIARIARRAPSLPVVVADRHLDLPGTDAVRIDDAEALGLVVDHLVSLGHRRIWHADGASFVSAEPRREAYLAGMRANGLADEIHVVPCGGSSMDGAATAMRLLEGGELPTAVVVYNDRAACGLIDVLWRHGVRIPDDVSVSGFDNIREARMPHLSITTVDQDPVALAALTAETVVARIKGAPPGGLRLMAPGALIVRSSTGPPRPASRLRVAAG